MTKDTLFFAIIAVGILLILFQGKLFSGLMRLNKMFRSRENEVYDHFDRDLKYILSLPFEEVKLRCQRIFDEYAFRNPLTPYTNDLRILKDASCLNTEILSFFGSYSELKFTDYDRTIALECLREVFIRSSNYVIIGHDSSGELLFALKMHDPDNIYEIEKDEDVVTAISNFYQFVLIRYISEIPDANVI